MPKTTITLYDVYIEQEGYFTLFDRYVNTPATIYNLTANQVDIIILQGWNIRIVSEHEEEIESEEIKAYYPWWARIVIVPSIEDSDKIGGLKKGDFVVFLKEQSFYIYVPKEEQPE